MAVIVHKFGGTSVGTPELIQSVAKRVVSEAKKGDEVVVVVSAMRDTTDELVELARRVAPSPRKRELDMLLTAGERISMALMAMAMHDLGVDAVSFTGSQSGIITDKRHGAARIIEIKPDRIKRALAMGQVVIVAGFQGVSQAREITTLGRGGSDTTAVALAAALEAEKCEILTDVDGIFTADPRHVPSARLIRRLSWDSAAVLTALGARILFSRSVACARAHRMPVHVRLSFHDRPGTMVGAEAHVEPGGVVAISKIGPLCRLSVPEENLGESLAILGEEAIPLRMVGARENGKRCLYVETNAIEETRETLGGLKADLSCEEKLSLVSAVGAALFIDSSLVSVLLGALRSEGVEVLDFNHSPVQVSFIIPADRAHDAVRAMHTAVGLDEGE
jgi:aspartate kinase